MRINHLLKNVGERLKCMYVMPDAVETTAYWDTGARQEQNRKEKKKKSPEFLQYFLDYKMGVYPARPCIFFGEETQGRRLSHSLRQVADLGREHGPRRALPGDRKEWRLLTSSG